MFGRQTSHDKLLADLFESGPIDPRHSVPPSLTGEWSSFQSEEGDRFFADFDLFAHRLNQIYTPSGGWDGGPWRLQELAETLIARYDHPHFGRRYSIFYNQASIGLVEINNAYDYDGETNPVVWTQIELNLARLLPFVDVLGFLQTLLEASDAQTHRLIDRALLAVLWKKDDGEYNPALELFLENSYAQYFRWKALVLANRGRP